MWLSWNGSAMRSQNTPGATSVTHPGAGGSANGNWRLEVRSTMDGLEFGATQAAQQASL